jgi:RND family efflux transporter MFP subunit
MARHLLAISAIWITGMARAIGRDERRPGAVANGLEGADDCLRRLIEMATQSAERSSQEGRGSGARSDRTSPRDDGPDRLPAHLEENGSSGGGWTKIVLVLLVLAAVAGGAYWWMHRDDSGSANDAKGQGAQGEDQSQNKAALRVGVVYPHKGGMARTTTQPGTLHAFQYADLYAKASGYLRAQVVDIGDTVEKGQVLAEVWDPERQQQVELTASEVERAKAVVQQTQARKTADEAAVTAAEATVDVRKTEVSQTEALRRFREKEFIRYVELARRQSVDQRVADEKQEDFEGAKAAEDRAHASVKAAEAELARAIADVITAEANIQHARAEQRVAEARLALAQIMVQYTRIVSPYSGVVTQRNFHDGDFIREAIRGDEQPILSVARIDLMRVIIYVPDRDTPLLDRGDPAVVRIDALGGEEFKGKVARFSEFELPTNRTMRTEVDLPNPTGRLRVGMYGGVSILLEPPTDFLTIPSKALHEIESGAGSIFVAEKGRARKRSIRLGRDDGILVEVQNGLSTSDRVIVSYAGSMEDGEPIVAESADGGEKPSESEGEPPTGGGQNIERAKIQGKTLEQSRAKGS